MSVTENLLRYMCKVDLGLIRLLQKYEMVQFFVSHGMYIFASIFVFCN